LRKKRQSAAQVLSLLDQAGKATLSETRRKTYAGIAERTRALSTAFDRLAKLTASATDGRKALFKVGDDVTAATAALVKAARAGDDQQILGAAQSVESAVLLVRVANWRFLATHDPKGPAAFVTNRQQADDALSALEAKGPNGSIAPLIGPSNGAQFRRNAVWITLHIDEVLLLCLLSGRRVLFNGLG
jgi:hypothetical protein